MTLLFFDRDIAKSKFNEIISVPHREWIAIIGDKGIGKSSFVKEVLRETPNLYNTSFLIIYIFVQLKFMNGL